MYSIEVTQNHGSPAAVVASDASPERAVRLAKLACIQSGKGMAGVRSSDSSLMLVYYGAGSGETEQAAIDAIAEYDANPVKYDWT